MQLPSLNKRLSQGGLAFHRSGTGSPLLLIHGVGMCAENWSEHIAFLSAHFDVLAIDLPGHGQSAALSVSFDEVELHHYAEVIAEFAQQHIQAPFMICGHSLGALLAVELVEYLPNQVSQVIALNTVFQRSEAALTSVQQRAANLNASDEIIGVETTLERWFGQAPSTDMQPFADLCRAWLNANSVPAYAAAYKTFAQVPGVPLSQAAELGCPALFMTGALDPNSTPAMSQALADCHPKHSVVTIEDAGHMLPLTHAHDVCEHLISLK